MRLSSALTAFLRGSLAAGAFSGLLLLVSCADFVTGQDLEPPGPLLVTRLTLLDPRGRDGAPIFTDTSSPLDCSLGEFKEAPACVSSPFMDRYSPKRSPPNPDSATKLRVVFNKVPLKLNGQDVEAVPESGLPMSIGELKLIDPNMIQLQCDGSGCGVPQSFNSLQVTGSDLSPDPTQFDFGPALQMEVRASYDASFDTNIPSDPLRALEPSTVYHVVLNPGLSGRNPMDRLQLDDTARALLTFTTEPFQVVRVGIGDLLTTALEELGENDSTDPYLAGKCGRGRGTAAEPYVAAAAATDEKDMCTYLDLANDGVIAVHLNAPADPAAFRTQTASATVSIDGAMPTAVPVKLRNGAAPSCAPHPSNSQRVLYVAPTAGTWAPALSGMQAAEVRVTLRGADIRDVSQRAGHPTNAGRHVLVEDVFVRATVKTSNTRTDGVAAADVLACP